MASSESPFSPTRWSLVLRAQGETPEAKAAISELCDACYQPVYRFLRREGRPEETALELAQSFFAKVLENGDLKADQRRGRFRSYLLGAVKHFLADQRKLELREKRGKGIDPVSLDDDENPPPIEPSNSTETTPDSWFDRQWALNVMDRGLSKVEAEWKTKGKADQFEALRYSLNGDGTSTPHLKAGQQLGWSETATKVAIHRLRKRFREIIRNEIAETIPDNSDVETELRYLIEALRPR